MSIIKTKYRAVLSSKLMLLFIVLILFNLNLDSLIAQTDKLAHRKSCMIDVLQSFNAHLSLEEKSKLIKLVESLNNNAQGRIGSIMSIGRIKGFDNSIIVRDLTNDITNLKLINIERPISINGLAKIENENLIVTIKSIGVDNKFIINTFTDIGVVFFRSVYEALDLPKIPKLPTEVDNIVNMVTRATPNLQREVVRQLPETIQTWFLPKGEGYHMAQIVYGIFKGVAKTVGSNPKINQVKIVADIVINKSLKKMFTEFGFVDSITKRPLTVEEINGRAHTLELLINLK